MTDEPPDFDEQMEAQTDAQTAGASTQQALTAQQQRVSQRKFNPNFLGQLQDPNFESDQYGWIREEFPAAFAGAHIVGKRGTHFEEQQELLNRANAETYLLENNPGRLLRENPQALAVMQGAQGTGEDDPGPDSPQFRDPMASDERRIARAAMEVATSRQATAEGGAGLDALTTATAEHRKVDSTEEESQLSSIAGIFD